jgi:Zn-dependent peptidase ImmA (M78 family)
MTQEEVVQRMGNPISAAALSQIEAGKVRPSRATLTELASALEVPPEFFGTQWPGAGMGGSVATYFRDLRRTRARERRRASALAMLLNDLVAAIEQHVRLPEVRIPTHRLSSEATRDEIEAVAQSVRSHWQLGVEPIPHVVRELERHGIPVARLTMGHRSVDAFSVRFDRRPIVLLAEDKSNYVRSRFDAAHELGHLVMHANATPGEGWVETQAHDFASSLLLPREAAAKELPAKLDMAGWAQLAELKRHWGISMSALLYRARSLGILGLDTYRNAMKYMSARGWRTTEPGDREMGRPEAPLLFERALREVQLESGMSQTQFVCAAHLPLRETLDLIKAATDQRPKVEL